MLDPEYQRSNRTRPLQEIQTLTPVDLTIVNEAHVGNAKVLSNHILAFDFSIASSKVKPVVDVAVTLYIRLDKDVTFELLATILSSADTCLIVPINSFVELKTSYLELMDIQLRYLDGSPPFAIVKINSSSKTNLVNK